MSDELGKVIEAELTAGFNASQFRSKLRNYKNRVPHKKIRQNLEDCKTFVSKGMVVNILYELPEEFEVDVSSARSVVLKKCSQFHIDETGAKFIGKNFQTFLVSNKFYTSYSTGPDKNLWSVAVAMIGGVQQFIINNTAVNFIA